MFKMTAISVLFSSVAVMAAAQSSDQDLGQAASDPTASLTAYILQDFYTPNYHGGNDGQGNRLQFRMALPYQLGSTNNIFRITLPYVTENLANTSGLSDVTVFNLTTFDRTWGRFGLGGVALAPTGSDSQSAERWAIGPAAGFVAQSDWGIWGAFNQNLLDIGGDDDHAQVDVSILQPIVSLNLADGWSIGTSDMSITYDWNAHDFISLPLGIQLNRLANIGGKPVQFGLSYEYNFYDDAPAPKDTIGFTIKVLSPT